MVKEFGRLAIEAVILIMYVVLGVAVNTAIFLSSYELVIVVEKLIPKSVLIYSTYSHLTITSTPLLISII